MSVYNVYFFPGPTKPLDINVLLNVFGEEFNREIGVVYLQKVFDQRGQFISRSDTGNFHFELMARLEDFNPHFEILWLYEEHAKLSIQVQDKFSEVLRLIAEDAGVAYIAEGLGVSGFNERFIEIDEIRYIDNAGFKEHYYRGISLIYVNSKNGGNTPVHPNIKFKEVVGDWELYELKDNVFEDTQDLKPTPIEISFNENEMAKAIFNFYMDNYQLTPERVTPDALAEKFPLVVSEFTSEHLYAWLGIATAELKTKNVQAKTIAIVEDFLIKRIEDNFNGLIPEAELNELTPKISLLLHLLHQAVS